MTAPPPPTTTTTTATQKGVGLGLFASDPDYDYGALLDEIRAVGATDVQLTVVWAQQRIDSSRIHRSTRPSTMTASDATVLRTLQQAKARGLRTTLFPIVRLEEHTPKEWRGRIAPLAGTDAWFASYRDYVVTMADLAARGGADRLSIGSELLTMEQQRDSWLALIGDVRQRFSGKLLYSSNWDHFVPVSFWDAVDEIGVTAYFELATHADAGADAGVVDDDALAAAWRGPVRELTAFARQKRKPLVITEVGYPSKKTAAWHPWDETSDADVDLALQARLYDAFCDAWKHEPLDGFYVWNWFGFGGDDDGGYTPRQKPAAVNLARCLRDPAWDPTPSPK